MLILDLDETLIFAEKSGSTAANFRVGPYSVLLRPHLSAFLQAVAVHFDLAVWTSSTPDYTAEITNQITSQSGTHFQFVWARDRCTQRFDPELQSHEWIKDLKKVKRAGYDLRRVLVVDDTSAKLARNYGNHVWIKEFTGDLEDNELPMLASYLLTLTNEPDYRAIEKRRWRASMRSP